MNSRRPLNRLAALAAIPALGVALSGCAYFSPTQTHHFYQAAEGAVANFTVETVDNPVGVRNLLVVVSDSGAELSGTFTNQTSSDQEIAVDILDGERSVGTTTVDVPAGGAVTVGKAEDADESPLSLSGLQAEPGDNVTAHISVGSETKTVNVQVLDDSLEYLGGNEG